MPPPRPAGRIDDYIQKFDVDGAELYAGTCERSTAEENVTRGLNDLIREAVTRRRLMLRRGAAAARRVGPHAIGIAQLPLHPSSFSEAIRSHRICARLCETGESPTACRYQSSWPTAAKEPGARAETEPASDARTTLAIDGYGPQPIRQDRPSPGWPRRVHRTNRDVPR